MKTKRYEKKGGVSGRTHSKHIDPALMKEITDLLQGSYPNEAAAIDAVTNLNRLYSSAGITTQEGITQRSTSGSTWYVRTRCKMDHFDAALLFETLTS